MTTVRPLLKYGWLKIASCGPQTYSSTSAPPQSGTSISCDFAIWHWYVQIQKFLQYIN